MRESSRSSPLSTSATPPYAAYASFEALLGRAAEEPIPPRIDKALLLQWGIAAKNESALLTSLRGLGLLEDDGMPSEDYQELRLSPPRRYAALRRALERAYPGLGGPGGYPLDPNRLRDYFVAERGLSGQMVEKATRFYRHLVEAVNEATRVTEAPKAATVAVSSEAALATAQAAPGAPLAADHGRLGEKRPWQASRHQILLTIQVDVPFDVSEEELSRFFQRVRRAWGSEGAGAALTSSSAVRRRRMS